MLSFSKLLLLALVIGAVWFGWRWVTRVNAIGRDRAAAKRRDSAAAGPARRSAAPPPSPAGDAEDMEKCPECGAYVAPYSAVSCGRPACPYGR
ncbi:hypothetical protein [Azospirillum doebereinerae]|uniref:Uncharacterized protein n=1 Tax=Azospirillum doebereinerae TaxID=92933 RepID=A0A3S0XQS5_9PROT|nr:hypothetical protein [Azospirillum doebereinerae]RUQ75623.1 hypothetical protein EJ913_00440 [Azospirillum doebereinerae]